MIDHLTATYGLSREDAYLLCRLVVDLKISEIVDAGQYVVSAVLPESIFLRSVRARPPRRRRCPSTGGTIRAPRPLTMPAVHARRDDPRRPVDSRARPGGRAWRSGRRRRRPDRRPGASPRPRPSGCSAGAKATNQAVVFFGSWAASAVGTQLRGAGLAGDGDARDRGGACRCRRATTAIIMSRTWAATFALTARLRTRLLPTMCGLHAHALVGDRRADRGHPERGREVLVLADRARRRRRGCP